MNCVFKKDNILEGHRWTERQICIPPLNLETEILVANVMQLGAGNFRRYLVCKDGVLTHVTSAFIKEVLGNSLYFHHTRHNETLATWFSKRVLSRI